MRIRVFSAVAAMVAATALGSGTVTGPAIVQAEPGHAVLPRPGGEFAVGTTTLHLEDRGRRDPLRPDWHREIMVSVFYPAASVAGHRPARYLSAQLMPELEKRTGQRLPSVLTNSFTDAPIVPARRFPVVLYSPGGSTPRQLGTGVAEELASRGYVVVTMDHTTEAPAVEFPGGRIVPFAPRPHGWTQQRLRQTYVTARVADCRLVLDSLTRLAAGGNPDAGHAVLPADAGCRC